MQKEKKIRYSNYKYEAYKRLNKLVLEQLQEPNIFRLPNGHVITSSDSLEFKIQYDVPENRYRIDGYFLGFSVCSLFYLANESRQISAVMQYPKYPDVGDDFFKKILSPIKKLMKYSLQGDVVSVKFHADGNCICYSCYNSEGKVIEFASSE